MNHEPKSILVTGCAGFIGSSFTSQFKSTYPHSKIVGIDDLSTGDRKIVGKEVVFYEGSILDAALLDRMLSEHRPEYIFHFAALPRISFSIKYPVRTTSANVVGPVTLLESAKKHGVKRLIYSSSSSVYGDGAKLPTKESENYPNPKSPYAVQKYSGELFCRVYSELFDLDTVCLRYFTVFGPGQYGDSPYSTVVAAWLESMFYPTRKHGFIEGDGSQSRDFCYIDNVVAANISAMNPSRKFLGDVFNIAHGQPVALNTVRMLIEKMTGRKLNLEQLPARLGDVKHTHADITKARQLLDYQPDISFEEGLARTIKWFESRTTLPPE